jgi:hypothetical protein
LRGFELVAVLGEPGCEGLEGGVEGANLLYVPVAGEAVVVLGVELEHVGGPVHSEQVGIVEGLLEGLGGGGVGGLAG